MIDDWRNKRWLTNFPLVREHAILLTTGVLTTIAISPVYLVAFPALGDLPNHLARMYILVTDGTSDANPFYQVHFALYPNLAMDILVPPMARLVGVLTATKIFLTISQLVIVSGSMAVEFAVKRRFEFSGFVALFVLYTTPFAFGLLNFEFGLGLALWGIALWIALSRSWWFVRLVVHSLFVMCLFVAHFFTLGVYGATIALLELPHFYRAFHLKNLTRLIAIMTGPALLILGLMILTGGTLGSGTPNIDWQLSSKIRSIFLFFDSYNVVMSSVIMAFLVGLIYFFFREHYLSINSEGKRVTAGLLLLFILLPFSLFGTTFVDVRMITVIVLILPAFIVIKPSNRLSRSLAAMIASLAIIANTGYTAFVWQSYQDDYSAIEASFGLIKKRSLVLVGHISDRIPGPFYFFYSVPTLAVHYVNAFVPNLSTLHGQQPIEVREHYKNLHIGESGHYLIPVWVLKAVADQQWNAEMPEFLRNWPQKYDYLYIIGPPMPSFLPNVLTHIASGRRFTLYRIKN